MDRVRVLGPPARRPRARPHPTGGDRGVRSGIAQPGPGGVDGRRLRGTRRPRRTGLRAAGGHGDRRLDRGSVHPAAGRGVGSGGHGGTVGGAGPGGRARRRGRAGRTAGDGRVGLPIPGGPGALGAARGRAPVPGDVRVQPVPHPHRRCRRLRDRLEQLRRPGLPPAVGWRTRPGRRGRRERSGSRRSHGGNHGGGHRPAPPGGRHRPRCSRARAHPADRGRGPGHRAGAWITIEREPDGRRGQGPPRTASLRCLSRSTDR